MRGAWPLLWFSWGFQSWTLAIPIYGPVLFAIAGAAGIDPAPQVSIFLLAYALSYAGWGLLFTKRTPSPVTLRKLLTCDLAALIIGSLLLLWLPTEMWVWIFGLFGFMSALPFLVWIAMARQFVPDQRRGWFFGLTGFVIHLLLFAIFLIAQLIHPTLLLILTQLLLLLPICLIWTYPGYVSFERLHKSEAGSRWSNVWLIFPLFLFIYLVGGLMYQVVRPFLSQFPDLSLYERIPYIVVMPLVGWLCDRVGLRQIVLLGIVGLGLAYTVFSYTDSWMGAFIGSTFINLGFSFLDVFVLFALVKVTTKRFPLLFWGVGLGVYVFSIFAGARLTDFLLPVVQGNPLFVYLGAILLLFTSFLFTEWMGKSNSKSVSPELDEELKLAQQVQRSMLPSLEKKPDGLRVSASMHAAKEVGGDFYDVIPINSTQTLFVIGDVMGKGLPAAMIMSKVIGLIRSEVHYNRKLTEIVQQVNRVLLTDANFSMFVTLGLALIDTQKEQLTYVSAGHVFPYLVHRKQLQQIEAGSLPIGIDLDVECRECEFPFHSGDLLFLYTDGLVEAKNSQGELYGFERLERFLTDNREKLFDRVDSNMILADVQNFSTYRVHEDDLTLLLVKSETVCKSFVRTPEYTGFQEESEEHVKRS